MTITELAALDAAERLRLRRVAVCVVSAAIVQRRGEGADVAALERHLAALRGAA